MPYQYNSYQAIDFGLLVTVVGREARGQTYEAMAGVAWSIRNRVQSPRYWGNSWITVISHQDAYSSMVPPPTDNDPNLRVYPDMSNAKWGLVLEACENAYWGVGEDPSSGATHYYDSSMDKDPPFWATAPTSTHTRDIDSLRFFRAS